MSRSNPRVNPKAKPPAIPDIPRDVPSALRAVLMGMKENIQLLNWSGGVVSEITRIQQSITHLNELTVTIDNSQVENSPMLAGVDVTCLPTRLSIHYTLPTNTGHSYTELYLQFSDTVADADGNLTPTDAPNFGNDRLYSMTQGRAFNVPIDIQYNRGVYIWLRHVNRVGHRGELYAHPFIVIPLAASQILETIEGRIDFTDLNGTSQQKITDIEANANQNKSNFSSFWEKSLPSVGGITTNIGLYADHEGKTSFVVRADSLTFVNADKKQFNPFNFDTTTGIAYLTGTVTGALKIQTPTKTVAHIDEDKALFDVGTFAIKDSTNPNLSFSFAISDYNYTDSNGNAQTKKVVAMNEIVVKNAVMDAITVTGAKETTGGTTKYSTTLTDVAVLGDSLFAGDVDISGGKISIGSNFSVASDGSVIANNIKARGDIEAQTLKANAVMVGKEHIHVGATTTLQRASYKNKWDVTERFTLSDDTKHYLLLIEIRNDSDWRMVGNLWVKGQKVLPSSISPKTIADLRLDYLYLNKFPNAADRLQYAIPIHMTGANRLYVRLAFVGSRSENPEHYGVRGLINISILEYHR